MSRDELVVEGHEGWQPHLVHRGIETPTDEGASAPGHQVVVEPFRVAGGQLNMRVGSLFPPAPQADEG